VILVDSRLSMVDCRLLFSLPVTPDSDPGSMIVSVDSDFRRNDENNNLLPKKEKNS